MLNLFDDLDMVVLETNPFCFVTVRCITVKQEQNVAVYRVTEQDNDQIYPVPLDLVMELDDTARFKNMKKWGDELEFPEVPNMIQPAMAPPSYDNLGVWSQANS